MDGEGKALRSEDVYRFGKVISPKTLGETLTLGVPLPATELVDLKKKIAWADVKFGASAINVLGEEIKVVRLQFWLLYTSEAADDLLWGDLGGQRVNKTKR